MPRSMAADQRLLKEVESGSLQGVEEALAAGASADGSRRLNYRPLMCAARWGFVGIAQRLVEAGADPEATASLDVRTGVANPFFPAGSRALHAAVSYSVEVGMIRVLLEGGADPDCPDADGCTPLANACSLLLPDDRLAIARELLRRGADPCCKTFKGTTPLHFAASKGDCAMLELLLAAAPGSLNAVNADHGTPMAFAASTGQGEAVEFLLSAGANDEAILAHERSSLFMAVSRGFLDVVRVLLSPKGVRALGGTAEIPHAVCCAVQQGQAKVLHLLLGVEGNGRRRAWANALVVVPGRLSVNQAEVPALQCAAMYGCLASTHVLLASGADERLVARPDVDRSMVIGLLLDREDKDPKKAGEIKRALARGPAYRARSWRWPVAAAAPSVANSSAEGGSDAAVVFGAGAAGAAAASTSLNAQIFRPTNKLFFTTRFERYSKK